MPDATPEITPDPLSETFPDARSEPPTAAQRGSEAERATEVLTPINGFDRLMFRLLVPGLGLPFVLTLAATLIASQPAAGPAGNTTDRNIFALVIGVFLFVQLGSQVLSGWLLLRRPASFYDRTLPRYTGVLYAISYGFQLAWLGVIAVDLTNPLGLAFAIALMAMSTMIAFTLFGTKAAQSATNKTAVSTLALGRGARAALWGYLTTVALALTLWLVGKLLPVMVSDGSAFNGVSLGFTLSAISLIIVVLLGLPWSHTLLGLAVVALFVPFAGDQVNTGGIEQWLDAVLLLPVLTNAAFAIIILRSQTRRIRLVNWFFRLKATTAATTTAAGAAAAAGAGATTESA